MIKQLAMKQQANKALHLIAIPLVHSSG